MQEMRVRSLGREDPLQEEMATHSSILAWRIPSTEEPGGLPSEKPDTNDRSTASSHAPPPGFPVCVEVTTFLSQPDQGPKTHLYQLPASSSLLAQARLVY